MSKKNEDVCPWIANPKHKKSAVSMLKTWKKLTKIQERDFKEKIKLIHMFTYNIVFDRCTHL